MRALLDVNVLIALSDLAHVHHTRAREWWTAHRSAGWASCPLTQNGFVRIISKPGYEHPVPLQTALAALATQLARSDHELWPDDISILDDKVFDRGHILGPSQITDVYLLALAVKNRGRLVTLDRRMSLKAVRGAEARHLVVLER
jgi:toxin-antitoxin system PIN domain toxin